MQQQILQLETFLLISNLHNDKNIAKDKYHHTRAWASRVWTFVYEWSIFCGQAMVIQ